MHIAVLGAGAIGSVFAGTLSSEHTVTLVGHDTDHLRAIQAEGLTITDPDGVTSSSAVTATTDHSTVTGADVLLVAVKSYDTRSAMADVADFVRDVPVLTLQNGLGNVETISEFVRSEQVLGGTTTNGAYVVEPGHVNHTGWGQTAIGRMWGPTDPLVEDLADTFRSVGFETSVESAIERAIWEKVVINVGINPTTALARVPNGHLDRTPPGEQLLESAVREAERVAVAEGIEFSTDMVDRTRSVARDTSSNRSSMLQDIESGSKTEIEALNGAIVDRAATHGIEVPVNQTLTDLVRLLERGVTERSI